MSEPKTGTEKLRDAIARADHPVTCGPYRPYEECGFGGQHMNLADAILALPEMVAALGVIEAAQMLEVEARKPEHEKWWRSPWAELWVLRRAVDAYDKAVKG